MRNKFSGWPEISSARTAGREISRASQADEGAGPVETSAIESAHQGLSLRFGDVWKAPWASNSEPSARLVRRPRPLKQREFKARPGLPCWPSWWVDVFGPTSWPQDASRLKSPREWTSLRPLPRGCRGRLFWRPTTLRARLLLLKKQNLVFAGLPTSPVPPLTAASPAW